MIRAAGVVTVLTLIMGVLPEVAAAPRAHSLDATECVPVIFVHGLASNSGVWETLQRDLEKECGGRQLTSAINYDGGHDFTNEAVWSKLRDEIEKYAAQSPNGKVDIVAHSMGGLVSRYLLAHNGEAKGKVRQLIMIATPNQGSWVAYGVRLSVMVYAPALYGITPENQDAYQAYLEGRKAFAEFRQYWWDELLSWKKLTFHEWIGEHRKQFMRSLLTEEMRQPLGRKVKRRTLETTDYELDDPYTKAFERLAAFYVGAYHERVTALESLGVDLVAPLPYPIDPSEAGILGALRMGVADAVAIDRLLPTYAPIAIGRKSNGSLEVLRIPVNPVLLELNEKKPLKPSVLHAYTGIQATSAGMGKGLNWLIDGTAGSVDPGYVMEEPHDGVVANSSVNWGSQTGLDSFFSLIGPNHLAVVSDPNTRLIIEALRDDYFALSGHRAALGDARLQGTVLLSPTRARPSRRNVFLRNGPASMEWEIKTDDPHMLSLTIQSQGPDHEAVIYMESESGAPYRATTIRLRRDQAVQRQLYDLPPNGRVILTVREPALIYWEYGWMDIAGPDIPPAEGPRIAGATATAFVVDISGSMEELFGNTTKIAAARDITVRIMDMIAAANQDSRGPHLVTLIPFALRSPVAVPLGTDTERARDVAARLATDGGTAIGEALLTAYAELSRADALQRSVVLLTDGQPEGGMSQDKILQTVAPLFRREGIPITAIGVGDGSNFDEAFLRELAAVTRGRYVSAADRYGLEVAFYDSYHTSLGTLLVSVDGFVEEGQIVEAGTFEVAGADTLDATLYWPGSDMELILVDPRGREVDQTYPGATWESRARPRRVKVEYPLEGTWTIRVAGLEIPEGGEPFHVAISTLPAPPVTVNRDALALAVVMVAGCAIVAVVLRGAGAATAGAEEPEKSENPAV